MFSNFLIDRNYAQWDVILALASQLYSISDAHPNKFSRKDEVLEHFSACIRTWIIEFFDPPYTIISLPTTVLFPPFLSPDDYYLDLDILQTRNFFKQPRHLLVKETGPYHFAVTGQPEQPCVSALGEHPQGHQAILEAEEESLERDGECGTEPEHTEQSGNIPATSEEEENHEECSENDPFWTWDRQRQRFVHVDEETGKEIICPEWFD
ncbi:hypothetical protein QBC40DRAFT_278818 [Triangularia verruculosa]|uniref:Uncharacterized protein n=1 Tax=Triangularia verruculosa TaxID=2587418 RepID=A0AAN6XIX3_9PEZI|nr:hypothetical protein QBC40DRAFT_278818 [Triangularia verruculosa]